MLPGSKDLNYLLEHPGVLERYISSICGNTWQTADYQFMFVSSTIKLIHLFKTFNMSK
jgi:hypothetical protein